MKDGPLTTSVLLIPVDVELLVVLMEFKMVVKPELIVVDHVRCTTVSISNVKLVLME